MPVDVLHSLITAAKLVIEIRDSLKYLHQLEQEFHRDLDKITRDAAVFSSISARLQQERRKRRFSEEEEQLLLRQSKSAEFAVQRAQYLFFDLAAQLGFHELATTLHSSLPHDVGNTTMSNTPIASKNSVTFNMRLQRVLYILGKRSRRSTIVNSKRLQECIADMQYNVQNFMQLATLLNTFKDSDASPQVRELFSDFVGKAQERLKNQDYVEQITIERNRIVYPSDSRSTLCRVIDGGRYSECIIDKRLLINTLREDQLEDMDGWEEKNAEFLATTKDLARLFSKRYNNDETRRALGLLCCLGYMVFSEIEGHYALVFHVPSDMYVRTLREVIEDPDIRNPILGKPSLDERKAVARQLANTVLLIHELKLVHKSINLNSIVLLAPKDKGDKKGIWGSPYLVSFGMTRFNADISNMASDTEYNIYHHPERAASRRIHKHHVLDDIYSLGVVLLEIGLLQPVLTWSKFPGYELNRDLLGDDIFEGVERSDVDGYLYRVFYKLRSLAETLLPSEMGTAYTSAVLACLNAWSKWAIKKDDAWSGSETMNQTSPDSHTRTEALVPSTAVVGEKTANKKPARGWLRGALRSLICDEASDDANSLNSLVGDVSTEVQPETTEKDVSFEGQIPVGVQDNGVGEVNIGCDVSFETDVNNATVVDHSIDAQDVRNKGENTTPSSSRPVAVADDHPQETSPAQVDSDVDSMDEKLIWTLFLEEVVDKLTAA